jgi:hypothetical protein
MFEESEVLDEVKAMNSDKALGQMVLLWCSSKLFGMFLKKILYECII